MWVSRNEYYGQNVFFEIMIIMPVMLLVTMMKMLATKWILMRTNHFLIWTRGGGLPTIQKLTIGSHNTREHPVETILPKSGGGGILHVVNTKHQSMNLLVTDSSSKTDRTDSDSMHLCELKIFRVLSLTQSWTACMA